MIVATADDVDPDHKRCLALLESHAGPLLTTALVVAEAGWLIERQLGPIAEAGFYRSVVAGDLTIVDLKPVDLERIAELVERYADLGLGGVDASLIALAERLDIGEIATLDRRDFGVVRPRHLDGFTLLP